MEKVIITLERYLSLEKDAERLREIENDIEEANEQYLIDFEKDLKDQFERKEKALILENEYLSKQNRKLLDEHTIEEKAKYHLERIPNWVKKIFL